MTNEQLDEARAKEAQRLWECGQEAGSSSWVVAARLARENWTPPEPEPVNSDVLAFREWLTTSPLTPRPSGDPNRYDDVLFETYLAGARMAREQEQEQERAKVLVEFAKGRVPLTDAADVALAKYWGEA